MVDGGSLFSRGDGGGFGTYYFVLYFLLHFLCHLCGDHYFGCFSLHDLCDHDRFWFWSRTAAHEQGGDGNGGQEGHHDTGFGDHFFLLLIWFLWCLRLLLSFYMRRGVKKFIEVENIGADILNLYGVATPSYL
jgi:hypothetical protein